jgi:integrase
MGSRRGKGEGSIRLRADGRFEATLTLPSTGGKRLRRSFFGKTAIEAAKRMREAQAKQDNGLPIPSERLTFQKFAGDWLEAVKPSLKPGTWRRYEEYARLHAVPALGRFPLARIGPSHLSGLYAAKLAQGLSPMTVRHLHAVLHRMLSEAARWGLVARNVAALVSPPKAGTRTMQTLSGEQVRMLLEAAAADRLEALYYLAVTTGMRQGEILGLRWQDVSLDGGTLQVRRSVRRIKGGGFVFSEPKSATSRRQLLLPEAATAALRAHKARQNAERLAMGGIWEDNDLVFPNELGRPIEAGNLMRRSFVPLLEKAGLPRVRFHDLRHTAATLLLSKGLHPKIVSEMLGHSQIGITLDLYSHVTPTMQREAAAAMDAIIVGR